VGRRSESGSPKSVSKRPKRLKPNFETFRELHLKSGNLCAFPGCDAVMMNEDNCFIGQLCHIEAAEPGGERFNPGMTNEQRRSAANLMLMCYPHHRQTNDVVKYSATDLKRMKAAHEHRYSPPRRLVRARAARLNRAALVGAGIIAGTSTGGILQQIKSMLDIFVRSSSGERAGERRTFRRDIEQGLRYAPTGTIYCFSRDPLHIEVGNIFLEIFASVGWLVHRLDSPPRFESREKPDFDRSMLMVFALKNSHQLTIVRQAIDELFERFGFDRSRRDNEAVHRKGSYVLTFYTPVTVQQRGAFT
jgi:hypothetical protein